MSIPTQTPNVRIESPHARKVIGNIFGYAALILTAVTIVDAAVPAFDVQSLTNQASAIVLGLFGLYQTTITSPNVPTT